MWFYHFMEFRKKRNLFLSKALSKVNNMSEAELQGIEIKFITSFYSPIKFIKKLALDYNVCVKSTFIRDYYFGNQTYIFDRKNTQRV